MSLPKNQPIGFHFINVAHPSDATTPRSLSQIRSHAAKDIRARAKRSRTGTLPPDETSRVRPRRHPQALNMGAGRVENNAGPRHAQEWDIDVVENRAPFVGESPFPEVTQICRFSNSDPHWSPARALSAKESFLLNHYISYLILFRNGRCHQVNDRDAVDYSPEAWFTSMQLQRWLPFALADPGLLAGLFLQSCHSLGLLNGFQNYTRMYSAYKYQCIRSTNEALSAEGTRFSDATICMVMVLAGDSYSLGDLDECEVHLRAFAQMLKIRGGLDSLGLGGFLKTVVLRSPQIFGLQSS